MLFSEKKSSLVRLSDCVKDGLDSCADVTGKFVNLFPSYEEVFRKIKSLSRAALEGGMRMDEADRRMQSILVGVPPDGFNQLTQLEHRLDTHSRSTVLMCCFCLEAYVNTLAYFLFAEVDFLGLIGRGQRTSADVLLEAIDRMGIKAKWTTIAKLGASGSGFNTSRSPYQDFVSLFNFRNDNVHDKIVPISDDRSSTRYNGKLPDPTLGSLNLGHALFAAQTYWHMVQEIHRLIGISPDSFHRQYNLKPWRNDLQRTALEELSARYVSIMS